jgi:hypothetical protein
MCFLIHGVRAKGSLAIAEEERDSDSRRITAFPLPSNPPHPSPLSFRYGSFYCKQPLDSHSHELFCPAEASIFAAGKSNNPTLASFI